MKANRPVLIIIAFVLGPWMLWSGINDNPKNLRRLASGVTLLISGTVLAIFGRPGLSTREAAEKVAQHVAALCEPEYEYAVVNATDFQHLDLAWYDSNQRWLEAGGFA